MTVAELSTQEILDLTREHTLYDWSVQGAVKAIAIDRAKGVYLWDSDGKRYLDFNSQLMSVNIGHGDERVIEAVRRQMERVCYVVPNTFTTDVRAEAGRRLAEVTPASLTKTFFTTGGADAVENAIRMARIFTGRHKIAARYRSYHGATAGAMTLTGEPRRWASEPGIPGVIRIPDFYPYKAGKAYDDPEYTASVLAATEEIIQMEGPHTVAAVIAESVVGTNGILIPTEGYIRGLRDICTKYGILYIADEVMAGFGRTGKWFAVDHWGVQPDIMTVAKGLTSSYVPLGATIVSQPIADFFDDKFLSAGLTYNSHAVGCAAAIACINIYKEDGLIDNAARMGEVLKAELLKLKEKHPCVGDVRAIGLFTILELVKNKATREPLVPFNPKPAELGPINKLKAFLLQNGLFTLLRWNTVFANPPLCVTEEQIHEGIAILDAGLELVDAELQ
ncbi:MAG: aminotransferase class III-fold pyridoxal phosphate-dependent enzyme [Chloroflexaceae bacterium]|jgi:taurine--2-oxoglutarate transaminase|nr:aminotransferase class III-fold pyridoxal phosphate-dependent enzyme [Chloroflexaceae bacterium]